MNHFGRFEIATYVLFHNQTMLKDVFSFFIAAIIDCIGVIVRSNDEYVSVFSDFAPTTPCRIVFFCASVHAVVFAFLTFTVHRIVFARYVTMKRWVLVSQISCCSFATIGAILLRVFFISPDFLATGRAIGCNFGFIAACFPASMATKTPVLGKAWFEFKCFLAEFTNDFHLTIGHWHLSMSFLYIPAIATL